ncbi:MutS protein msh4 [Dissophora globulifera]|nr:MutS protein msh4 [Dissophora globulifera]
MLNCATARNLELTINLSNHSDKETLFGIMNEINTDMGARSLRSNILQPLTDERTISTRLGYVQGLSQTEEMLYAVKSSLKLLGDVDHLITAFTYVPTKPSARFAGVRTVPEPTPQTILRLLTDPRLEQLLSLIDQTYKETINETFEVVNRFVEDYNIHLKDVNVYDFRISQEERQDQRLLAEVYLMSDKIVSDLSGKIRHNIGVLYKASESIAMLDILMSFAHSCSANEYIRPEFTYTLSIKKGRYPTI